MTTICEALGYPDDDLEPSDILPSRLARAQAIISRLAVIDEQIEQAIADSAAVEIDSIKVNFGGQVAILKQEGSRLLKELSTISKVGIWFDKYSGQGQKQQMSSPISVTSYW